LLSNPSSSQQLILAKINDAERKQWIASAKPRLKRDKFANDKRVKIELRNPPDIEKISLKYC